MSVKKILNEHKDLFLGLIMICGISLISIFGNTEWFRASILQVPEKFDGAVYPIEKVPNWFTWGGNNKTAKFSEIAQANLVKIADYKLAVGGKTPSEIKGETEEKQAKLTYPVVYMGNYDVEDRTEGKGSHLAVDIRVPVGTPIRAIANAKVVKAVNSNSGFGKHIVLEIRNAPEFGNKNRKTNYYVNYCHLSKIDVKVGEIVKRGQIIGKTGQSGTSTTPHLHFQIDKKDAPWHPYWPFTAKEAYQANLNFFTAVSAGLGKENAKKYTINPLIWIDENLNNNLKKLEKSTKIVKKTKNNSEKLEKNVKFEILGKEEFEVGKNLELKIYAKDENGKIIKNFKPSSDVKISSTSNTAKFSKILKFKDGIAKISIKNPQAENFSFEIKTKNKKFTKNLISKEAKKQEVIISKEEKNNSEKIVKQKENVAILNSDDNNILENGNNLINKEDTEKNTEKNIDKINIIKKEEKNIEKESIKKENIEEKNIEKETEKKVIQEVKKEVKQVEKQIKKEEKQKTENLHSSAPVIKKNIFTDVGPENPNYEAIKYLKENGVIGGYADGSFKPEKTVSRVEALKMIFTGLKISTENAKKLSFKDTSNDAWYSPFVGAAMKKGIAKGYSDGTFKPAKPVNRSEYYKILLLSAEINPSIPSTNPFADVDKNSWFGPYIGFVKDANLVKVNGENFYPADGVSRAEVAESLYNLIKFLGK